jgi:lipopolysaccharide/colanic/teichoic acid biosynthesis glycosyltransferase
MDRATASHVNRMSRIRYQIGGALLVAVLLPYFAYVQLFRADPHSVSLQPTLVSIVLAIASGHYLLRSLSAFPGAKTQVLPVPIFLATYGAAVGGLLMTRTDYNRPYLLVSLFLCIGWYIAALVTAERARQLRIGVVPFGRVEELTGIAGVDWQRLEGPEDTIRRADGIVADLHHDLPPEWERRLAQYTLAGVMVYDAKQLREALTGRVKIDHLSENTFGSLMPIAAYLKIKLVLDIALALVALPFVLLLLAMLWIPVTRDSPGPLIFRQKRVGYRGRVFTLFKVRTMAQADPAEGDSARSRAITVDGDPRITRLGRFLRRTRIDELPQVFNILLGQMSWIGPRPEAAALSEWYESELPFYVYRHVVRPGLTGWAQVNQGHVAEVHEVQEKLENDFYYIKYFSPWLDILIVVRTIGIVFSGFGAR